MGPIQPALPDGRSGSASAQRVVVVGGGISGLAAAAEVRRLRPAAQVQVLDASPRVGGKLRTETVGGVQVDVGAEAMLNRRPEAVTLAADSGVSLVHPATTSASIWTRDRMRPLPRSLMGIPADLKELGESGILSRSGQTRALLDHMVPATRIGTEDVSVGWLVEERFGKELLDRLVEPLLGGVYAGYARELSARATIPQVVALLDRDRSLSRSVAASLGEAGSSQAPVFAGIEGGVGTLPGAVVAAHSLQVETESTVRRLVRSKTGWNVVVGPTSDPRVVEADAVVVAVPAAAAARLLADEAPEAALELARIETASMAVVTMAFPERDFPAVQGSGFLVPPVDGRTIKAATYSFAKWGWVRAHGAADALLLLRASVGRHREESALQVPDAELVATAVGDLADAIGLSLRPVDSHVQRWGGGLPQYAVGHLDRVARIRAAVARQSGLAVAGASYEGIGIPACIRSGQLAAMQVVAALDLRRE